MPPADDAVRRSLIRSVERRRDEVVAVAQALIAAPSPNPPLATGAVAVVAEGELRRLVPDIELSRHETGEGVVNLVARVTGTRPGRRLVFNGHLDTYPVNEDLPWTVDPFGGVVRDGCLYGRGAADMKGGIAASMVALGLLAEHRDAWAGEAVLTLGGDEESMGRLGTQWLIDHVPHATGDAVLIGDAGSPSVLRFGEKGFLWVEIAATGHPAHGAHVHLGRNAIDRLRAALDAVSALRDLPVPSPDEVTRAIAAAKPVSEALNGPGESDTLLRVTVNVGAISGGTSMNLVPAAARAGVDIRLPVGVATADAEAHLARVLSGVDGVSWTVQRRVEPSYTPPGAEIVRRVAAAAREVLGRPIAVNMRVGGSDARLFRPVGMPTVVYGPTPHNMGGADEHALVDDLGAVASVHALSAFDFLSGKA